MLPTYLMGRMSFTLASPTAPRLPAGRHLLGIAEDRDYVLHVPASLPAEGPVPLLVMFHGANGFPDKVAPFLIDHAEREGFLLLLPQSLLPTWDIVIGGSGPDLERLEQGLGKVCSHFQIDPKHLGFAGFSDGGSYALSIGITNGDIVSHVMVFSGGFMSVFMQNGMPKILIAHGTQDEQLPIESAGRAKSQKLKSAGYDVKYVEFDGRHVIHPPVVEEAMTFFLRG